MKDLYFMGGPAHMAILTLLLTGMVAWMIYAQLRKDSGEEKRRKFKVGQSIGLFALMTGILFQLIGFYYAFSALEEVGEVAPAVLYGGLKVSLITTVYGLLIYMFSILLCFVLSAVARGKEVAQG